MRISTGMIYDIGVATLQQRQQDLVKLQQQVSSGRRILTPADDPVASAAVLDVTQSKAVNDQYKTNSITASFQLGIEENALSDVTTLLQNVKTLVVNAANPTLSNPDRGILATELESTYQQLLAIANRDDGNGAYLFAGFQGATPPFAQTTPGNVTYNGDAGQRLVQIGAGRAIAVNDAGETVFRAIRTGNGTFVTGAGPANSGSAVVDIGTVANPALWNAAANAGSFTIRFNVSGGVTTYDVVDTVNNVSLLTGAAPAAGPYLRTYAPGGTVNLSRQSPPDTNPAAFDFGAAVSIAGAPAHGDTITIARSTNQDIFKTLQGLITNLRNGVSTAPGSSTSYANSLNGAMTNLDSALDNVLTVLTSVGARLKEVDSAQSTSEDLSLQYSRTLSGLQDLDYAKALSDLTLQQTYLQAAQQSFIRVTSLNLFSLL